MSRTRILIMGAAGRDFHNFNTAFRDNDAYEVVAFTATQIPNIEGRAYPPELAGSLYPSGIPIYPEDQLVDLIQQHLNLLSKDFGRFRERMERLSRHISQAHKDVGEVSVSARKISSRFEQIERVELDALDEQGQLLASTPAAGAGEAG